MSNTATDENLRLCLRFVRSVYHAKMYLLSDSPELPMAVAARKREHEPALKMFHATVLVTRAEEWCVEAETAEEARELLAQGEGHRCHLGDRLHAEVQQLDD